MENRAQEVQFFSSQITFDKISLEKLMQACKLKASFRPSFNRLEVKEDPPLTASSASLVCPDGEKARTHPLVFRASKHLLGYSPWPPKSLDGKDHLGLLR